jgi:hypothetical protein
MGDESTGDDHMPIPLTWAVWTLWSFACAMAIRVTVVRLFKPSFYPIGPYAAAYLSWVLLFAVGMGLAILTGFRFRGGDHFGGSFRLGDYVAYFSPFGLPLLAGAPLVLVLDLTMIIARWLFADSRKSTIHARK